MLVHEIIDLPDPRRLPEPAYGHTAVDDLVDVLHAVAEILERNKITLTREGWIKMVDDAVAVVDRTHGREVGS